MPHATAGQAQSVETSGRVSASEGAWERLRQLLPTRELTRVDVPSDDLQWAGDPTQEALTREMARGLYRAKPGHLLLVGDAGVGKTSLLGRFARSIRNGEFPFLDGVRVLLIDVSNVDPEDSRACLELIFLAVQDWGRCILCLDGVVSLLRRSHGRNNKPLLRALLHQTQQGRPRGIVLWGCGLSQDGKSFLTDGIISCCGES